MPRNNTKKPQNSSPTKNILTDEFLRGGAQQFEHNLRKETLIDLLDHTYASIDEQGNVHITFTQVDKAQKFYKQISSKLKALTGIGELLDQPDEQTVLLTKKQYNRLFTSQSYDLLKAELVKNKLNNEFNTIIDGIEKDILLGGKQLNELTDKSKHFANLEFNEQLKIIKSIHDALTIGFTTHSNEQKNRATLTEELAPKLKQLKDTQKQIKDLAIHTLTEAIRRAILAFPKYSEELNTQEYALINLLKSKLSKLAWEKYFANEIVNLEGYIACGEASIVKLEQETVAAEELLPRIEDELNQIYLYDAKYFHHPFIQGCITRSHLIQYITNNLIYHIDQLISFAQYAGLGTISDQLNNHKLALIKHCETLKEQLDRIKALANTKQEEIQNREKQVAEIKNEITQLKEYALEPLDYSNDYLIATTELIFSHELEQITNKNIHTLDTARSLRENILAKINRIDPLGRYLKDEIKQIKQQIITIEKSLQQQNELKKAIIHRQILAKQTSVIGISIRELETHAQHLAQKIQHYQTDDILTLNSEELRQVLIQTVQHLDACQTKLNSEINTLKEKIKKQQGIISSKSDLDFGNEITHLKDLEQQLQQSEEKLDLVISEFSTQKKRIEKILATQREAEIKKTVAIIKEKTTALITTINANQHQLPDYTNERLKSFTSLDALNISLVNDADTFNKQLQLDLNNLEQLLQKIDNTDVAIKTQLTEQIHLLQVQQQRLKELDQSLQAANAATVSRWKHIQVIENLQNHVNNLTQFIQAKQDYLNNLHANPNHLLSEDKKQLEQLAQGISDQINATNAFISITIPELKNNIAIQIQSLSQLNQVELAQEITYLQELQQKCGHLNNQLTPLAQELLTLAQQANKTSALRNQLEQLQQQLLSILNSIQLIIEQIDQGQLSIQALIQRQTDAVYQNEPLTQDLINNLRQGFIVDGKRLSRTNITATLASLRSDLMHFKRDHAQHINLNAFSKVIADIEQDLQQGENKTKQQETTLAELIKQEFLKGINQLQQGLAALTNYTHLAEQGMLDLAKKPFSFELANELEFELNQANYPYHPFSPTKAKYTRTELLQYLNAIVGAINYLNNLIHIDDDYQKNTSADLLKLHQQFTSELEKITQQIDKLKQMLKAVKETNAQIEVIKSEANLLLTKISQINFQFPEYTNAEIEHYSKEQLETALDDQVRIGNGQLQPFINDINTLFKKIPIDPAFRQHLQLEITQLEKARNNLATQKQQIALLPQDVQLRWSYIKQHQTFTKSVKNAQQFIDELKQFHQRLSGTDALLAQGSELTNKMQDIEQSVILLNQNIQDIGALETEVEQHAKQLGSRQPEPVANELRHVNTLLQDIRDQKLQLQNQLGELKLLKQQNAALNTRYQTVQAAQAKIAAISSQLATLKQEIAAGANLAAVPDKDTSLSTYIDYAKNINAILQDGYVVNTESSTKKTFTALRNEATTIAQQLDAISTNIQNEPLPNKLQDTTHRLKQNVEESLVDITTNEQQLKKYLELTLQFAAQYLNSVLLKLKAYVQTTNTAINNLESAEFSDQLLPEIQSEIVRTYPYEPLNNQVSGNLINRAGLIQHLDVHTLEQITQLSHLQGGTFEGLQTQFTEQKDLLDRQIFRLHEILKAKQAEQARYQQEINNFNLSAEKITSLIANAFLAFNKFNYTNAQLKDYKLTALMKEISPIQAAASLLFTQIERDINLLLKKFTTLPSYVQNKLSRTKSQLEEQLSNITLQQTQLTELVSDIQIRWQFINSAEGILNKLNDYDSFIEKQEKFYTSLSIADLLELDKNIIPKAIQEFATKAEAIAIDIHTIDSLETKVKAQQESIARRSPAAPTQEVQHLEEYLSELQTAKRELNIKKGKITTLQQQLTELEQKRAKLKMIQEKLNQISSRLQTVHETLHVGQNAIDHITTSVLNPSFATSPPTYDDFTKLQTEISSNLEQIAISDDSKIDRKDLLQELAKYDAELNSLLTDDTVVKLPEPNNIKTTITKLQTDAANAKQRLAQQAQALKTAQGELLTHGLQRMSGEMAAIAQFILESGKATKTITDKPGLQTENELIAALQHHFGYQPFKSVTVFKDNSAPRQVVIRYINEVLLPYTTALINAAATHSDPNTAQKFQQNLQSQANQLIAQLNTLERALFDKYIKNYQGIRDALANDKTSIAAQLSKANIPTTIQLLTGLANITRETKGKINNLSGLIELLSKNSSNYSLTPAELQNTYIKPLSGILSELQALNSDDLYASAKAQHLNLLKQHLQAVTAYINENAETINQLQALATSPDPNDVDEFNKLLNKQFQALPYRLEPGKTPKDFYKCEQLINFLQNWLTTLNADTSILKNDSDFAEHKQYMANAITALQQQQDLLLQLHANSRKTFYTNQLKNIEQTASETKAELETLSKQPKDAALLAKLNAFKQAKLDPLYLQFSNTQSTIKQDPDLKNDEDLNQLCGKIQNQINQQLALIEALKKEIAKQEAAKNKPQSSVKGYLDYYGKNKKLAVFDAQTKRPAPERAAELKAGEERLHISYTGTEFTAKQDDIIAGPFNKNANESDADFDKRTIETAFALITTAYLRGWDKIELSGSPLMVEAAYHYAKRLGIAGANITIKNSNYTKNETPAARITEIMNYATYKDIAPLQQAHQEARNQAGIESKGDSDSLTLAQ